MDEQTELLREAVELLRLIAEPQIAKRDEKLRGSLYEIVGKSDPRAKAIRLMDGTRAQSEIGKQAKIDSGGMSRLTTALRNAGLLSESDRPKIVIPIPAEFTKRGDENG